MGNKSSTSASAKGPTSNSSKTESNPQVYSSNQPLQAANQNNNNNTQHKHTPSQLPQQQQQQQPTLHPSAQQQQSQAGQSAAMTTSGTAAASGSMKENPLVGQWLKNIPLLAKLTDSERAQLGGYLVSRNYADGDTVIRQGEAGEGFFIIARGEVIVTRTNDSDGQKNELGRLKDGQSPRAESQCRNSNCFKRAVNYAARNSE